MTHVRYFINMLCFRQSATLFEFINLITTFSKRMSLLDWMFLISWCTYKSHEFKGIIRVGCQINRNIFRICMYVYVRKKGFSWIHKKIYEMTNLKSHIFLRIQLLKPHFLKFISKMFGLPNKWLRKATLLFRLRRLGAPSVI